MKMPAGNCVRLHAYDDANMRYQDLNAFSFDHDDDKPIKTLEDYLVEFLSKSGFDLHRNRESPMHFFDGEGMFGDDHTEMSLGAYRVGNAKVYYCYADHERDEFMPGEAYLSIRIYSPDDTTRLVQNLKKAIPILTEKREFHEPWPQRAVA